MAESEMVERVARALDPDAFAERLPGHEKGQCPSCDYRTELAMSQARKAIEAMREPTEAMKDTRTFRTPTPTRWEFSQVLKMRGR